MRIENFHFQGEEPGVRLVVFGAIHGNEHCGPKAIRRIMERIESGKIRIARGSVRFVPVCNPEAYARNVRCVEENLNRVFKTTADPKSYEARLANELCALLKEHADMLLDLHSTSAPGPMSLFVDHPTPRHESYAQAFGAEYMILDWPAVYANNPHGFESNCTSDYAFALGIPSVTVECGQHEDAASVEVAERAIMRALSYAKIIDAPQEALRAPRRIYMRTLEKKNAEGDAFTRRWQHLEVVPKGAVVARREDGEEIIATEESVMLLPKHHANAGEEWFYLGVFDTGA